MDVYNIIKLNIDKIDYDTRILLLDHIKGKISDSITGIYDINTTLWDSHIQYTSSLSDSYKQYILSHNQFSTILFFDDYKPYDIYYNKCRCSFINNSAPGIEIIPYINDDLIDNTPTKFWFKPIKSKTSVRISFSYKTLANDIKMYINIDNKELLKTILNPTNNTESLILYDKTINLLLLKTVLLGFIFNSSNLKLTIYKPRIYKTLK